MTVHPLLSVHPPFCHSVPRCLSSICLSILGIHLSIAFFSVLACIYLSMRLSVCPSPDIRPSICLPACLPLPRYASVRPSFCLSIRSVLQTRCASIPNEAPLFLRPLSHSFVLHFRHSENAVLRLHGRPSIWQSACVFPCTLLTHTFRLPLFTTCRVAAGELDG